MVKTRIKCENCGTTFEYDEKPGYPRKYCPQCSALKKQEYENRDKEPTQEPISQPGASKREFHLTPEQVRTNALQLGLQFIEKREGVELADIVAKFENYLRDGVLWA